MNLVKEIKYREDGTKLVHIYKKKTLAKIINQNNKIVVSSEIDDTEFNNNDFNMIRVKNRLTIFVPELPNYKIEVTFVYNYKSSELNIVQNLKNKLLPTNIKTIEEFMNRSYYTNSVIEIEFERISKDNIDTATLRSELMEIENFMSSLDDDSFSKEEADHNIFNKVKKMMFSEKHKFKFFKKNLTFKDIGNRPIEVNRNIYYNDVFPEIENYYLTEKTDGKRAFVLFLSGQVYLLTMDTEENIGTVDDNGTYLFDCELTDKEILVFDIMYNKNKDIKNTTFEFRYGLLKDFDFSIVKSKYIIKIKYMCELTSDLEKNKKEAAKFMKIANIDGLIFTNKKEEHYYDMKIYKWKPIEHVTLDFLIKRLEGDKYVLFCGINRNMADDLNLKSHYGYLFDNKYKDKDYFPIEFKTTNHNESHFYTLPQLSNESKLSDKSKPFDESKLPKELEENPELDIDGKIGEFWFNIKTEKWELKKLRKEYDGSEDLFGNDFRVCQLVFINYENPLLFDDLFTKNQSYFNKSGDEFLALRKYNLKVKHKIFDKVTDLIRSGQVNDMNVLDLSCGQGADMWYLASLGYKTGMFCDIDKSAIAELLYRYYNYKKSNQKIYNLKIYTQVLDLLDDATININKIKNIIDIKYHLISMQFAIHYFANEVKFRNLCKLIHHMSNKNGYFYFTCFKGDILMDKFVDDEIKFGKFHIIKMSKDKIKVKLPFSEEYKEEYMVFDNMLNKNLKDYGFELVESDSFNKYFGKLELKYEMTENDMKFSELYYYYIYKKINNGLEDTDVSEIIEF